MNEWSRLVRTVAPDTQAVSLEAFKKHIRVDFDDDDSGIEGYLYAAIAAVEGPNGIGIALTPQTWRMSLDYFPAEIIIPLGPVTEISEVTYTAEDGTSQSVATWRVDMDSSPCRIWPARDSVWPTSRREPSAVKITFKCGFTDVPWDLKAAIMMIGGHLYNNREAVTELSMMDLPMGVDSILDRYRVGRFA